MNKHYQPSSAPVRVQSLYTHAHTELFLLEDPEWGSVVLKSLREGPELQRRQQRLENEYEISRSLEAPGLRRALKKTVHKGLPALILEYVSGQSLRQFLAFSYPFEKRLRLALNLVRRLQSLHEAERLHLCLNPHHVLIHPEDLTVTLIDFGQAQAGPVGTSASVQQFSHLQLAYFAPEQLGLRQRPLDARTDLYALGVILFEIWSAQLPFQAKDAMEMRYAHLAVEPAELHPLLKPWIPGAEVLTAILSKILAKNPDERYQRAQTLAQDLERCLAQYQQNQSLPDLIPAQDEQSTRFHLSPKLYGRERVLQDLEGELEALKARQRAQCALISGSAGSGKSALLQELYPQILKQGFSYLSGGKFMQNAPLRPHQAFVQALADYLQQAREPEQTRAQIQLKLGPAWSHFAPQLQSSGEKMHSEKTETLSERVLSRYLAELFLELATQNPLVLFIDDLQWADRGSLQVIEFLMQQRQGAPLLLLSAYRHDEPAPDLERLLKQFEADALNYQHWEIQGLKPPHIQALIQDSLKLAPPESEELAQVVHEKTGGNALFVRQFLASLHEKGLFQAEAQGWRIALNQIRALAVTPNLLSLLQDKFKALNPEACRVLEQAACLGTHFGVTELHILRSSAQREAKSGEPQESAVELKILETHLRTLLDSGLIYKSDPQHYTFAHDKIQQAAYEALTDTEREELHGRWGRYLLKNIQGASEEALYQVLHHFHLAELPDTELCVQLAQISEKAARLRHRQGDRKGTLSFAGQGLRFLSPLAWHEQPKLFFELTLLQSEALMVFRRWQEAEANFELLERHAHRIADRSRVATLKFDGYSHTNQQEKCFSYLQHILQHNGFKMPPQSSPKLLAETSARMLKIYRELRRIPSSELHTQEPLPQSEAFEVHALMGVLDSLLYLNDKLRLAWVATRIVELTLRRGQTTYSVSAYVLIGLIILTELRDRQTALKIVNLAKFRYKQIKGSSDATKLGTALASVLLPYFEPLRNALQLLRETRDASIEQGDIQIISYNYYFIGFFRLIEGHPLPEIAEELLDGIRQLSKVQHQVGIDLVYLANILPLQELTGQDYDVAWEGEIEAKLLEHRKDPWIVPYYRALRLRNAYLLGEDAELESGIAAGLAYLKQSSPLTMEIDMCYFYLALAMYKQLRKKTGSSALYQRKIKLIHRYIKRLGTLNPGNFQKRALFLQAEEQAYRGDLNNALKNLNQVIVQAERDYDLQTLALAHQRMGEIALEHQLGPMAEGYLSRAVLHYRNWGAQRVADSLIERYAPYLRESGRPESQNLSTHSLIQSTQAIAEERQLGKVMGKVLKLMRDYAGAQRVVLLSKQAGELCADAQLEQGDEDVQMDFGAAPELPQSLLAYWHQEPQVLLLHAALEHAEWGLDPYIRKRQVCSVLLLPLFQQGQFVGAVYLENRGLKAAFYQEQLEALQVLAAQAAISLAQARLYQQLEATVEQRTRQLAEANAELTTNNRFLEQLNQVKDEFLNMVSHDLKNPLNSILLFSRYMESRQLSEAKSREIAGMISKASKRMFRLLEDLLELNRLEQGKLSLELERLDLRMLLQDLQRDFEAQLQDKKQRILLELPEHVEQPEQHTYVEADSLRVRQVLENLVSNALKFSQAGSWVRLQLQIEATRAVVMVQDQGPGIAEAEQALLFLPFAKLSPQPTDGEHSSGLGLSIVKKLLDLMDAEIWLESAIGQGSRFYVAFKRADASEYEAAYHIPLSPSGD